MTARRLHRQIATLLRILKLHHFSGDFAVEAHNNVVVLSRLEEECWPNTGYSRGHLLYYYLLVARWILPNLRNRAVVSSCDLPAELPDFVKVESRMRPDGSAVLLTVINNLAALLFVINRGVIELRVEHATTTHPGFADRIVFDCGREVARALELRQRLASRGLTGYPRTGSGGGLEVVVPIKQVYPPERVLDFARLTGERLLETSVVPYSALLVPPACAATPLQWEEVNDALRAETFTIRNMRRRINRLGNLSWPVLRRKQELPGDQGIGTS